MHEMSGGPGGPCVCGGYGGVPHTYLLHDIRGGDLDRDQTSFGWVPIKIRPPLTVDDVLAAHEAMRGSVTLRGLGLLP